MSTILNADKAATTIGRPINNESNKTKLIVNDRTRQANYNLKSPQESIMMDGNNNNMIPIGSNHSNSNSFNSGTNNCKTNAAAMNAQTSDMSTGSKAMLVDQKEAPSDKTNTANLDQALEPQSSRKTSSSIAKFKEKRPEPLKLNPNINQEIPLDLSVKSAGNIPSSLRGCIFNLALSSHQMATLETPRIQWQDNESFLSSFKSRLFSTSTSVSQRARLSSILGESSPNTPGGSFLDIISNSATGPSARSCHPPNQIEVSRRDAPTNVSPFNLSRYKLLDKLSQTNGSLVRYNQLRNELKGTPRRSCSTDNLNYFCGRGQMEMTRANKIKLHPNEDIASDIKMDTSDNTGKKNSISPLAMKSLSNNNEEMNANLSKFSYMNDNQMMSEDSGDRTSPTVASLINNKAVTPISVANATANLLNIHLNSPTRSSDLSPTTSVFDTTNSYANNLHHQQPLNSPYQTPSLSSLNDFLVASQRSHPEPSPLDPLLSAVHCQQLNQRASLAGTMSSSTDQQQQLHEQRNSLLHNSYLHRQNTPSLTGSTSLNTPTLISPSQLKSENICFLPSPTLSPMSSVFELPSPLLMFSQNAQSQLQQHTSQCSNKNSSSSATFNSSSNNNSVAVNKTDCHISNPSKIKSDSITLSQGKPEGVALDTSSKAKNLLEVTTPQKGTDDGNQMKLSSGGDFNQQARVKTVVAVTSNSQILTETNLTSLITPSTHKIRNSTKANFKENKIDGAFKGDYQEDEDVVIAMDGVESDEDLTNNEKEQGCTSLVGGIAASNSPPSKSKQTREPRPTTVIPQIYVTEGSQIEPRSCPVSDHVQVRVSPTNGLHSNWTGTLSQQQSKSTCALEKLSQVNCTGRQFNDSTLFNQQQHYQRIQLDRFEKRALSPKSFQFRASLCHNERLESSSAPPGDYQRRARAKIKTVTTDSCVELATPRSHDEQAHIHQCNQHQAIQPRTSDVRNSISHQKQLNEQFLPLHLHDHHYRHGNFPYPMVAGATMLSSRMGTSFSSSRTGPTSTGGVRSYLNGRSSSAEPPGIDDTTTFAHFASLSSSSSSAFHHPQHENFNGGGTTGQLHQNQNHHGRGLSHSAQHLQCMASFDTIGRPLAATNATQQTQRQSSSHAHDQHSQHHSISVGELDKIALNNRIAASSSLQSQPTPFLVPAGSTEGSGGSVGRSTDAGSEIQNFHQNQQRPSIQPHQQNRPFEQYQSHNHQQLQQSQPQQQHLLLQNPSNHFRSSANELDNLLNHHQASSGDALARCIDQKRFNSGGQAAFGSSVVLPSFSGNPSTVNLFGHANAAVVSDSNTTTTTSSGNGVCHSAAHQAIGGCLTPQNRLFTVANSSNGACHFDAESRSDSMSSNSLDFCPIVGMDVSRSSSAASSNVSAKKYHCDKCSKSFTRSDMLSRHRRLHSGDRPFQCTECKQEFSRSDHLSTHMRTHTGEKPYKCKLCSYTACRKDMITRHMKVHNRSPESMSSVELMDST